MAPHTRPRPSSIDLLPEECEEIVAWAAQELARSGRSQTEIYAEFQQRLKTLQMEMGSIFPIPAFSSFNRHALKLSNLTARLKRSRMMADAIVDRSDGEDADNVTKAATLTLKTLILEMLESAGEAGFSPKEAMSMAGAMRALQVAENLSTARRQKIEKEFSEKVTDAVDAVAKAKGLSSETVADIRAQILGVQT
jgi:Skp family chaperone for outer membrane proteins